MAGSGRTRNTWVVCGWVASIAGVVVAVGALLAILGGAEAASLSGAAALGAVFVFLGRWMAARGRTVSAAPPAVEAPETGRLVRRALWIGGLIVLGIAAFLAVLLLLARRAH